MKHLKRTLSGPLLVLFLLISAINASAETIKVGYNNWIGFIGFFVAEEAGYFEDRGIDVVAKEFAAPGEGLVPLMTGDLDVHLTTLDSVVQKSAQAPGSLQVVYLHDTSNGADALIGGSTVSSIADLKGHSVGVTVGECNHLLLVKALESIGLKESDIKMRNMDPDAAGAALKAGAIDAAVTWEPWISEVVGDGGQVLYSTAQAPNLILDCMAIAPANSADKSETIKAFVEAVNLGNELAIKDPEKAAAIVAESLGLTETDVLDMLSGLVLYGKEANLEMMNTSIGESASELLEFFMDQGSVDGDVDLNNLVSTDYLN